MRYPTLTAWTTAALTSPGLDSHVPADSSENTRNGTLLVSLQASSCCMRRFCYSPSPIWGMTLPSFSLIVFLNDMLVGLHANRID